MPLDSSSSKFQCPLSMVFRSLFTVTATEINRSATMPLLLHPFQMQLPLAPKILCGTTSEENPKPR